MAAIQRLGRSAHCIACQRWLISAFLPELNLLPPSQKRQHPISQRRRGLRTARSLNSQYVQDTEEIGTSLRGDDTTPFPLDTSPSEQVSSTSDGHASSSEKPWYLQVQDAQFDQPNSIAARQQLPELPLDPPKIFERLMRHLSVDIGLDYISLVDLRTVDPPPALGTNLIMIFGTARSEKHLHVSADRFCRWLRTEHKLTPYADGLLGRNEFKLKMRRKLRRTRILDAAGAKDLSDTDDGISTGWVCVNLGTIDETEALDEELGNGAVGFGRQSNGTQVVVQMMTEEKRGELDLEGLWTGVLKGSLRRQDELANAQLSSRLESSSSPLPYARGSSEAAHSLSHGPVSQRQHVRRLHTSRSCQSTDGQSAVSFHEPQAQPDPRELEPHLLLRDEQRSDEGPGSRNSPNGVSVDLSTGITLRTHLNYLTSMSDSSALEALGVGEHDKSSTPFLQSFFDQLPVLLNTLHWDAMLRLHSHALHIAHPGYTQHGHVSLLRSMMASTTSIAADTFERAFEAVLFSQHTPGAGGRSPFNQFDHSSRSSKVHRDPHYDPADPQPFKQELHALRSSLGIAFEILDYMEGHGHDVCTESNLIALHNAISEPRFLSSEALLTDGQVSRLQLGFRQALQLLEPDVASIPKSLTLTMLTTYAQSSNWQALWQVWSSLAMSAVRRDEMLYQTLFDAVATSSNTEQARRVLHDQIGMMERESPPVRIEADGALALAVARALRTAGYEPSAEQGRWRQTWHRCLEGIELLPRDRLDDPSTAQAIPNEWRREGLYQDAYVYA